MTIVAGVLLALAVSAGTAAGPQADRQAVARLGQAAREGKLDEVVSGARGLPLEALDSIGEAAACAGRPAILRALVELGARPGVFGAGALHCLYRTGAAKPIPLEGLPQSVPRESGEEVIVEVVRLLVTGGADLNARFDRGPTILQAAVGTCHPGLVAPLLAGDVALDAVNATDQSTALMIAVRCQSDMITMLLARGASAGARDSKGRSAVDMLATANLTSSIYRARLAALMEHGARPQVLDGSALAFAAAQGNLDAVKVLLSAGADANGRNAQGDTPLHGLAAKCWGPRCEAMVAALIEAGADPKVTNLAGRTPYEVARDNERAPFVGHLLAQWNWTALRDLGAIATSSEVLVEKGRSADFYSPGRALDGGTSTCWCVRVRNLPTAEGFGRDPTEALSATRPWIAVHFARPARVRALRVYPGCSESPDIYRANNEVARLHVEVGKRSLSLLLPGGMRFHDLGISTAEPVESVRFEVEAIRRGSKFDDTCIAEIQAVLE